MRSAKVEFVRMSNDVHMEMVKVKLSLKGAMEVHRVVRHRGSHII
jgi:hypothetical protein